MPAPGTAYYLAFKDGFWRGVHFNVSDNGSLNFTWSYPNPQQYSGCTTSSGNIQVNQWFNIVVTLDGPIETYYLNGSPIHSCTTIGTIDYSYFASGNSNSVNLIGCANSVSTGNQYFTNGIIDDFGIWDRVLTQQEITGLYTPCTQPSVVTLGTDRGTIICPDDSVKIFVVSPTTVGLTYQWYRNNVVIPGAISDHYYAPDFARYKVNVSSGPISACLRVSGIIEPTLTSTPAMTITPQGSTSICQGDSVLLVANPVAGYNYQWKRYGVNIAGATTPNYYASQAGTYKVQITNASGCNAISAGTPVYITCRLANNQIVDTDIAVYPNPTSDNFTIQFKDIGEEIPALIELRDSNGGVIDKQSVSNTSDVNFSGNNLAPGSYSIRVVFESGDVIDRVVNIVR